MEPHAREFLEGYTIRRGPRVLQWGLFKELNDRVLFREEIIGSFDDSTRLIVQTNLVETPRALDAPNEKLEDVAVHQLIENPRLKGREDSVMVDLTGVVTEPCLDLDYDEPPLEGKGGIGHLKEGGVREGDNLDRGDVNRPRFRSLLPTLCPTLLCFI